MEIFLVESLKEKLSKPRFKPHYQTIKSLIRKLKEQGKNSLKFLDIQDQYILGEMKVKEPPYRLYVILNQKVDAYYIVDWSHKDEQARTIKSLKEKLKEAISIGIENIF
ncbi:MAG: hypothetical protein N3D75_03830 [Candidatus Aenigmarchaeota archaeon]|nr:hypothetical protein [Candidatus Aenigmarchaeota archaeon]